MPFAPVMLDDYVSDYLMEPFCYSPYMTIGFNTTERGYSDMIAACHPADKTARAQILEEVMNPELYGLLRSFAAKTGRGALLNTSFNIHGKPIIMTPGHAVSILTTTSLDGLLLDEHFVRRIKDKSNIAN